MEEDPISPMPPGMINGNKEDEIADMMAYLMSGGNPSNRMFQPLAPAATPAPAAAAAPAAKK